MKYLILRCSRQRREPRNIDRGAVFQEPVNSSNYFMTAGAVAALPEALISASFRPANAASVPAQHMLDGRVRRIGIVRGVRPVYGDGIWNNAARS